MRHVSPFCFHSISFLSHFIYISFYSRQTPVNADQCDSSDVNASKEMPSGGWFFSRMFSRSTTKDDDARDHDETDGDEHIDELAKRKGTSDG